MADTKKNDDKKPVETTPKRTGADAWLPEEVAKKYKVVNWMGPHRQIFGFKYGVVDLKTISLRKAEKLVRNGFTKLEERK